MSGVKRNGNGRNEAFLIAFLYAIIGFMWITLSDHLVAGLSKDIETLEILQNLKGWFFILFTATLLFWAIRNRLNAANAISNELTESERKFSSLVQNLQGMVYRCNNDRDYTMQFISAGGLELTGYRPEELINNRNISFGDLIHGDDAHYVWTTIQEQVKRHEPYQLNYRIKTADGNEKWVSERGGGIFSDTGELLGLEGVILDISETVNAEEALRKSESQYRLLVENQTDLIVKVDVSGRFLYVSRSYCQTFGLKEHELIGKTFMPLVHPDDKEITAREMEKLFVPPHRCYVEQRAMTASGWRWLAWADSAILDEKGEVTEIIGVGRDITDRKKAEESLREREEHLRALVEAMPDIALVLDREGRYLDIISRHDNLLYKSRDSLLGRRLHEVFPEYEADVYMGVIIKTLETDSSQEIEYELDTLGGHMWFEARTSVLHAPNPRDNRIIWMARDVTARKKAEEEKLKVEAQLRQQQKLESIGTLAGGIAHEINNPINIIMNYGELILHKTPDVNDVHMYAEEIINESERVAGIVRNLLAFSRQENETHMPQHIDRIIRDTISLTDRILAREQISIDTEIEDDLPLVECRNQQIMQVLMNLITNARDALNARFPQFDSDKTIYIHAHVFNDGERNWVRTTVEDHGVGIPQAVINRIFDPFFTTKPCDKGTGLGLSVSHGIVSDHKGRLIAESVEGEYTRMHMDLPPAEYSE